jgi:hypothetical protein
MSGTGTSSAAPADDTTPDFIAGPAWQFNQTLMEAGAAPIGFDAVAAAP